VSMKIYPHDSCLSNGQRSMHAFVFQFDLPFNVNHCPSVVNFFFLEVLFYSSIFGYSRHVHSSSSLIKLENTRDVYNINIYSKNNFIFIAA